MDTDKREAALLKVRQNLLNWGASILMAHGKDPLFRKQVSLDKTTKYIVSMRLSGALTVHDAKTGELLVESIPGKLNELREGFGSLPPGGRSA